MPVKKMTKPVAEIMPMLKSVEQMSITSGIGICKLRELIDKGELEYVKNGNRYLLADRAIWDWYERNRIVPQNRCEGGIMQCQ